MFNKEKCPRCNHSVKSSFEFCPSCGKQLKDSDENFGILGRNDNIGQERADPFMSGLTGGMLGKMLGSTLKLLEKELQREMMQNKPKNANFELFINGKKIDPKNIKVTHNPQKKQQQAKQSRLVKLPDNALKDFKNLPQEEPKTNIRRLSDSIIYEIEMPGVKSEKDISIKQIGNSLEIRATAKNKAYLKTITVNLGILNYEFNENQLVLELEAKN